MGTAECVPFQRGGGNNMRLCGPELWGWGWEEMDWGEGTNQQTKGWVCLKGLSAFGIMIQWKYCVADCCRIFLHRCNSWWNYSPWWSVMFSFSTCSFHCKTALAYLLSPQNIRCVPCLDERLCAFGFSGLHCLAAALLFGATHPILTEWDVIATIGLYNNVHKSSLCECTFDKVYLFICKHLIINRQYI